MGTTKVKERIMGFVEVKVNGQWINLMAAEIRCQLCNEAVVIAEIAIPDKIDDGANATWTCKKCHAING
jgi:uncharacterized protein with PIN domain